MLRTYDSFLSKKKKNYRLVIFLKSGFWHKKENRKKIILAKAFKNVSDISFSFKAGKSKRKHFGNLKSKWVRILTREGISVRSQKYNREKWLYDYWKWGGIEKNSDRKGRKVICKSANRCFKGLKVQCVLIKKLFCFYLVVRETEKNVVWKKKKAEFDEVVNN